MASSSKITVLVERLLLSALLASMTGAALPGTEAALASLILLLTPIPAATATSSAASDASEQTAEPDAATHANL